MNVVNVYEKKSSFAVLAQSELMQTAVMELPPGDASGPKSNEHGQSEQILYVVEGEVRAEIGDRTFTMSAGDSVIVPRRVAHRFTNVGSVTAVTFNVYSPPAY